MTAILKSACAALLAVAAWGQTAPAFEVTSIKPSDPAQDQANVGVHIEGTQITYAGLSLKEYLRLAFKLQDYQVVGPDWLASAKFDTIARLPPGATTSQVPAITQVLLTGSFGLKFHRDSKQFPVYALLIAQGGLKIKESPAGPDAPSASKPAAVMSGNLGSGSFAFGDNRFTGHKLSMSDLAEPLGWIMRDKPVVNLTDAPGKYDLALALSQQDFRIAVIRSAVANGANVPAQALKVADDPLGDSLSLALEKLGLRLEARNAPLEVVVVDRMEQAPALK